MKEDRIFVHIPFFRLHAELKDILELGVNLEIYFSAQDIERINLDDLKDIKALFDKHGIKLLTHAPFFDLNLGSVEPLVREATLSRFKSFVSIVDVIKPLCMVIHTGYDKFRYANAKEEWLINARSMLKEIDKIFPDELKIALENVFDEDPFILLNLINDFNSNRFGLCFDIGHFNIFSRMDVIEWLKRTEKRLFELHLHDNSKVKDNHWGIGRGNAPVFRLIDYVIDKKLDVFFTIEAHTKSGAIESLNIIKEKLYTGGS